jgi:hypothetical protein
MDLVYEERGMWLKLGGVQGAGDVVVFGVKVVRRRILFDPLKFEPTVRRP